MLRTLLLCLLVGPLFCQTTPLTLEQKEQFLLNAKVIRTQGAKKGITGTIRATLSDGKITHDASIQRIDEEKARFDGLNGTEINFRDTYKFNIAGYRLGRMLGLGGMIPPSVDRVFDGSRASWTWWVEDVQMDEGTRLKQKVFGPDKDLWGRQTLIMRVFDQLIFNTDRNVQNILYDKEWRLWMIDHSRAFRTRTDLLNAKLLDRCDRHLLTAMKRLTMDMLKAELANYLRDPELKGILARREKIVAFFEKGGEAKLYDFLPAASAMTVQPGIFQGNGDVGVVTHAGSVEYDAARKSYRVTASGENVWGRADAFHFVWKKVSGDVSVTAEIEFSTKTGDPHKKAMLMMRQSLDADAAYADVAVHASGLTSLQSREEKGEATHEVQSNVSAPKRVRLTKAGAYSYISVAAEGEDLRLSGGLMKVPLRDPFYVGIGVSAHNKDAKEEAVFRNVEVTPPPAASGQPKLYSTLETITVASTDRRVLYTAAGRFEAPNWTKDNMLLYNGDGRLHRIPAAGGKPETIDTGFATRLNNDHAISPDGTMIAISDQSQEQRRSLIYVVPIGGGTPRRVTEKAPSYFHGWSPDGKTLAYCAERGGNFDVYTIPVAGGEEARLTTAEGLDDGPEYSPDGNHIYFNSIRSGLMQIWRMKPDGSEQEQVTPDDGYNNWFPHLSPDGQRMVFITFEKDVTGHPANKDVMLRMMTLSNRRITILAKLFGGQGTINVPSWSPDGRKLAFVSYQLIP
ncbi:MAG: PD40 domain-containing protein [Candidatus Solibacter usitatus]|nr:PD40 domain-containing protein [Candidatus Solibacter usitatus]